MEVLGLSAAEVAETLETSVAAVNSALQRARATLANRDSNVPTALSAPQESLLKRYVSAFERYDVDELVSLLRADATFSMPPYALWLQGPERSHLDARDGLRLPRFPAGSNGRLRIARLWPIPAQSGRWV
jgi:hypothetical protein